MLCIRKMERFQPGSRRPVTDALVIAFQCRLVLCEVRLVRGQFFDEFADLYSQFSFFFSELAAGNENQRLLHSQCSLQQSTRSKREGAPGGFAKLPGTSAQCPAAPTIERRGLALFPGRQWNHGLSTQPKSSWSESSLGLTLP